MFSFHFISSIAIILLQRLHYSITCPKKPEICDIFPIEIIILHLRFSEPLSSEEISDMLLRFSVFPYPPSLSAFLLEEEIATQFRKHLPFQSRSLSARAPEPSDPRRSCLSFLEFPAHVPERSARFPLKSTFPQ